MTKYLIFQNQRENIQLNLPGSREEMACAITKVILQEATPADQYFAYASFNPNATIETLKGNAKFSVEIDAERAEIWQTEIVPLTKFSEAIDHAFYEAYSAISKAAWDFDKACEESQHFRSVSVFDSLSLDAAMDILENFTPTEISEKVEEVFEFKHLHSYDD